MADKRIPGPKGYPLLGQLFSLVPGRVHQQCTTWAQTYGDLYEFWICSQRIVVLTSSRLMRDAFGHLKDYGCVNNVAFSSIEDELVRANQDAFGTRKRYLGTVKQDAFGKRKEDSGSVKQYDFGEPKGDLGSVKQDSFGKHKEYSGSVKQDAFGKHKDAIGKLKEVPECTNQTYTHLNDRPLTFFGSYVFCDQELAFSFKCEHYAQLSRLLQRMLKDMEISTEKKHDLKSFTGQFVANCIYSDTAEDINRLLKTCVRDYISKLLIGEPLRGDDDSDQGMMWEFIDNLYTMIDPSIDGPLKQFPWLRHLPGKYGNAFRRTIASRDKVAKRFFDDHKTTYVAGTIRGLVDVCIKTQMENKASGELSWLTDEYIKGLIYDTLAAGMTELMKTLRLFILLMCHHPDVQCRLQREIDAVVGTDKFPTADDQQWMPYTTAAILEVLRYGSQTPLAIPHRCNKDVVLDGYPIQEGTVIFPNLWGVHHDEAIWGDPWEFRPDRFLHDDGSLLPPDHTLMTNVIPFGVGKRACPGQMFARSRTFICIASLLQRVQFAPPDDSELPSADSRLYTKRYPLTEPDYQCRVLSRENIII